MAPDKLVWIQIRGICWEAMELQPASQTFDIALSRFGGVSRMSIYYQDDLFAALHEVLQEEYEGLRVELSLVGGCPKGTARIDRADHIDALPLAGGLDNGSFSLQPISSAQRGIRLESGLIQK